MKWLILTLVILSMIIIIPPIAYNYVYPTAGDDTASHLIYFQNMDTRHSIYYGQYAIGKILNLLSFPIMVSFLWFHFIVLVLVMWVVGLTVAFSVNTIAGILATILVFGVSGLVGFIYYGQIFDVFNIGILLPLAVFSYYKWKKGIGWKVVAISSLVVFGLFHANGGYVIALIPLLVVYEIIRSRIFSRLEGGIQEIWGNRVLMSCGFLGFALLCLFTLNVGKPDPFRLLADGKILGTIFASGALGIIVGGNKRLLYGVIASAIVISLPTAIIWCQNNSAVKDTDKQAIAYLNSLNGVTYTGSPQVAKDIYNLFVNKKFVGDATADYAVIRNVPMTPKSDPDDFYFEGRKREKIVDHMDGYEYRLLKEFNYGEKDRITNLPIIIEVYGKVSS